jgi:hypothetical protein
VDNGLRNQKLRIDEEVFVLVGEIQEGETQEGRQVPPEVI